MSENAIPFYKPAVGAEELAAIERVLNSGHLTQGPEVEAFEKEAAAMLGVWPHHECVAVSSCTAGLYLLLKAHGIQPGQQVFVPNLTFAATINAVIAVGARPVLCDVNLDNAVMCAPDEIDGVGWAIFVTFAGEMRYAVKRFDANVIVDQAHSFQPGAFRPNSAWSFFPTKNITTGEGGLVGCSNRIAEKVRTMRDHGRTSKDQVERMGSLNFRMTDVAAAMGREQLKKLPAILAQKRMIADIYREGLETTVILPPENVTHLFWIQTKLRDHVSRYLWDHGVQTSIHYRPLSEMANFACFGGHVALTNSLKIGHQTLSLPFYPDLSRGDAIRIVQLIKEALR